MVLNSHFVTQNFLSLPRIYTSNPNHTSKIPEHSFYSFFFFFCFLHRIDLTLSNTVDVNYQTYFPRWKRGIKRARRVRTSVPLVPFGTVAGHLRSPSSPMSSTTTTTKDREIKKMKKKSGEEMVGRGTRSAPATVSFQTITLVILYALPGYQSRRRRDVRRRRTPRSVVTPRVAGRTDPLT